MKKKYSKPDIMFESFTLSNCIAAGCENPVQALSTVDCGVLFSGIGSVFTTQATGCVDVEVIPDQDGDGMWGTLCYHVPVNTATVFNS